MSKKPRRAFSKGLREVGEDFDVAEARSFPIGDAHIVLKLNPADWEAAELACRNEGKRLDDMIAEWSGICSLDEITRRLEILALQHFRTQLDKESD